MPLPVQFFGIFPTGGTITEDDQTLPWSDELEHKVFVSAIGVPGLFSLHVIIESPLHKAP